MVKDTGVGIPKEDQDRVFERFTGWIRVTLRKLGVQDLAFDCETCSWALKGSVILRSEEGNGTEICMKFPKVHKE